ncbi:MAG: hypothetical protein Q9O62_04245 [Ardenticatenia bacterium]|nr:hypothetical protein [Ardenticatenia bacterium]
MPRVLTAPQEDGREGERTVLAEMRWSDPEPTPIAEAEARLREQITYVFHAVPYGWGVGKALADALAPFEAEALAAAERQEWSFAALVGRILLEEVLPAYQQVRLFDPDQDLLLFLNRVARHLRWIMPYLLRPDEYAAAAEALADVWHTAHLLNEPLLAQGIDLM